MNFFKSQMSDLRSVDIVESDEIPASPLELASEKRTELVEGLAEIDDEIIDLFLSDVLPAAAHGTFRYNDRRLLVEPEVGSLIITATEINTLIQFHASDYGMENCSLVLYYT